MDDDTVNENENENNDNVIDGGVAGSNSENRQSAAECDLVIYMECGEELQVNGVAKQGAKISIGMDKNCKVGHLFEAFTRFCNNNTATLHASNDLLVTAELEFVHMDVLMLSKHHDMTADACALMKGDCVVVRKNRSQERVELEQVRKRQEEMDQGYFKALRSLLPDLNGSSGADIIFDCQSKINGGQQVLSTVVKAHACIVARRCPWLGEQIKIAKKKRENTCINVITIPSDGDGETDGGDHYTDNAEMATVGVSNTNSRKRREVEASFDEDADGRSGGAAAAEPDEKRLCVRPQRDIVDREGGGWLDNANARAAEVEAEEDEDIVQPAIRSNRRIVSVTSSNLGVGRLEATSPVFTSSPSHNLLRIPLKNHSPEAVKLLLEFCYTNRCISLGQEAFLKSSPGAADPFPHGGGWPRFGEPIICMDVALAGISLAEEAKMSKFSLMCEIAASHLLTNANVLNAISLCSSQAMKTGNRLPILQKKATAFLLRKPVLDELSKSKPFLRTLSEKCEHVVPALFSGTRESLGPITMEQKRAIAKHKLETTFGFTSHDALDRLDRMKEREKWRASKRDAVLPRNVP
mmetsp:Transcript_24683/g.38165  ORF Transcript_24683/g.38165 Transcript_24683/m.38165 type:complete len:581 (+) Transcript_24683:86-1828(+)